MCKEVYKQKLEHFRDLVMKHDLFYSYSDDHRVWLRGQDSWAAINEASVHILPDDAAEIWNEMIDKNVREDYRSHYYTTAERWLKVRG